MNRKYFSSAKAESKREAQGALHGSRQEGGKKGEGKRTEGKSGGGVEGVGGWAVENK